MYWNTRLVYIPNWLRPILLVYDFWHFSGRAENTIFLLLYLIHSAFLCHISEILLWRRVKLVWKSVFCSLNMWKKYLLLFAPPWINFAPPWAYAQGGAKNAQGGAKKNRARSARAFVPEIYRFCPPLRKILKPPLATDKRNLRKGGGIPPSMDMV